MMLNLYKLYFQPNKKKFHPSTFPPPNQTKMRETKKFSILPLFHSLSIFYLLIFFNLPTKQTLKICAMSSVMAFLLAIFLSLAQSQLDSSPKAFTS